MQYLSIENASKSYGDKILFKNINLSVSKGDRIALIAKNGSGKSTLMRTIAGLEGLEGENAKMYISKEINISILDQDPIFDKGLTVLDAIYNSEHPKIKAMKNYQAQLLSGSEDGLRKAMLQMDDFRAWDADARAKEILAKLEIKSLDAVVDELSGGQKKRLALASLILEEPDFLIMDEPTNHLDIEMIEWLEDYLSQPNITLLMVSHDRYFIEKVCNEIIELDRGHLYMYRGTYSQYLEKKEARLANEAVNFDKNRKLFKRELEWMRRQPQARTTKAKSRIDDFYEIKDKVSDRRQDEEMSIMIEPVRMGSKILELHNVSKSYDNKRILNSFTYKFKKAERLGIVGKNGSGKSTFLKLITERLAPDGGKVVVGETIQFGYYGQDGLDLSNDKMVIDVIRDIADYIPLAKGLKLTAESLLERFLFPRSQHRVYISQLSGGEKRRLYLLTVLMKNPNFLILDEPTNDLDILTLNVLEDYLMDYPGCLIVVSHDRYFMDKLIDHLFVFEGDGEITDFPGNYTEYRFALKNPDSKTNTEVGSSAASATVSEQVSDNKRNFELNKELKTIEKQLEKLEKRKEEINALFENPELNHEDLMKYSKELESINEEISTKEEKWMEISEQLI